MHLVSAGLLKQTPLFAKGPRRPVSLPKLVDQQAAANLVCARIILGDRVRYAGVMTQWAEVIINRAQLQEAA